MINARPLEKALYAYHFEDGTAKDVLAELTKFQNPDGGFGHGLEPDVRLPDSSVIATTIAFQRFREINAPASHPLVVSACRYLRQTYNQKHLNWSIIPPNVDDAPHAPWWQYDGELMNRVINPRAEILGYLYDYPDHFPAEMRDKLTCSVMDTLLTHADEMEMHDVLCAIRLSETVNLPEDLKTALIDKLSLILTQSVTRDREKWSDYGLPPLTVVDSPDSPFAALFIKEIPHNLDFLMQTRAEDGSWYPNWAWEGDARQEWSGVLTLINIRVLRAFGRIED
jgi:hypothetical protein